MATVIDKAVEFAVAVANDDSHGYSQQNRWGNPDYDCSSLVISAYKHAGVDILAAGGYNSASMIKPMLRLGFVEVTNYVNFKTGKGLQKGDVVWKTGHVEMMSSATHLVGAHGAGNTPQGGDQTGHEIDVKKYTNKTWTRAFRYPGGSDETIPVIDKSLVISANRYLSKSDMYNNAVYIAAYLLNKGWTLEAICGMLGNMQAESTINPGIWQSLNEGNLSGGFGLVQWTPASKLFEWCDALSIPRDDIDSQLQRIEWEVYYGVQYYPTDDYPETFEEFTTSTKSVAYLAKAFLHNYERPAEPNDDVRADNALYWYSVLSGLNFEPGSEVKKRRGMSLMLMYAAIARNR